MEPENPFEAVERKLGYRAQNRGLLAQALTHSSFANENAAVPGADPAGSAHYERLEFLGDAVVELVVSDLVVSRFPDAAEGELSKLRAGLVNTDQLARMATALGLGDCIRLGKGEQATGGSAKPSILADVFEALIAVVFLEAGFDRAREVAAPHFISLLDAMSPSEIVGDFKTPLQERVQALLKTTPVYRVICENGPDHMKTFEVEVIIKGECLGRGQGRSKKEAEQEAAKAALSSGRFDQKEA